ncbi:hypothetical protein BDZ89DRAFT_1014737 [Hymenopellis radicata]|nr:hypothetical protein BDZ89DRAFT_1014737 [Hymenopellis radicata]
MTFHTVHGIHKAIGALVIGTWANTFLYFLETQQVVHYFRHYKKDNLLFKFLVTLVFFIDTLSTLGNYACVYLYTIIHWGDMDYLQNQYWPIPVYLSTTGASAAVVQTFLITRFYHLSRNHYVAPFLGLISLTAFGGAVATAVVVVKYPLYHERYSVRTPVTVWLVASAAADILIASSLIYQLHTMKSTFKHSQSLLRRLSLGAVQTGAPGSIVATIALCVYLSDMDNNVSVGLAFCLGRIYALTMLMNLNKRHVLQLGIVPNTYSDSSENSSAHMHAQTYINGIHVHRSAVVRIDDRVSDPKIQIESGQEGSMHELDVKNRPPEEDV